jgi:undecaprenyl-diphosphatase
MGIADQIIRLAEHLGHWGYAIIFVVVLLESQPLLGLFFPGESIVLVGGFLAGQGVFDLDALIVTISFAAITGDTIGYELGRHLGRAWLERHARRFGVREKEFAKIDHFLTRHGGKAAFFSHFMHLLRALMPFMAGASRMPYKRFVFSNALGCIVWASLFSLAGYFLGESWKLFEKWIGRAGAVIGGLLVLIIIVGRLWSWMLQHELELRSQWQGFLDRPMIAALRRRFAPQIVFLENRLTPGGYLGLHLTIGASIVLLTGWWFGGIAQDLLATDPLIAVDHRLAFWFNQHATTTVTRIAEVITFAGSPVLLTLASITAALILFYRRAWYCSMAFLLTVGGGALLNSALKYLFQRPRPIFEHPLIHASGYSFPSGHMMGAMLFYGFMAVIVVTQVNQWRWRALAPLLAFLLAILIGLSRVYLGAHYLSDVMAAAAAGLAWLAFCVTGVEMLKRYHERARPSPDCVPGPATNSMG